MQKRSTLASLLLLSIIGLLMAACVPISPNPVESEQPLTGTADAITTRESETITQNADATIPDYEGPVTEIAIRRLPDEQDIVAFTEARDAFVALLTAEPGVGTDREFQAIIDGTTFGPPDAPVFTGMTQYENLAAFAAASEKLGSSAEAATFFATFEPQLFTALRPKNPDDSYDLATIVNEPGQILEIAARDFSQYENFDAADYEARLSVFLEALSEQPGFVAEYQWISVLDPTIVIGMTVYESVDAFSAIAQDQEFMGQMMPFISDYPPFASYIHVDARATVAE